MAQVARAPESFDAIVVGSGATGGWAAKKLTEGGMRVALVEAGAKITPQNFTEHVPPWELPYLGKSPKLHKDRPIQSLCYACTEWNYDWFASDVDNPYTQEKPFRWIRMRVLGGRSMSWGRQSYRMSDLDFKAATHDGYGDDEGGIERWLRLTDALGLPRDYVLSAKGILPGTRFAVEAYLHFVLGRSVLEGIASSLTELFASGIHAERIEGMLANYAFIDEAMMGYFRRRLSQAPRDVNFALRYVLAEARTKEAQQAVIAALIFKTEVLWAQLDALHFAYVQPGLIAPGAYDPGAS